MVRLGVWILVILSLLYSWGAEACPDKCKCEPSNSCTGTYVNCVNRGLTRVPTNIPNDTCWLNLRSNQLTTLEKGAFEGLGNLQYLYLYSNKLTTLQKGLFEGLTKLTTLNLRSNQLTTLEKGAFEGLGNLQYLRLYFNQLTTLEKGAFEGLGNLQTLYLYNNRLTTLQKGLFEGLTKLTELYLNNNRLTTLQKGLFEGLTKLTKLAIQGNPLRCNCQMVEFVSFATTKSLTLRSWMTDPRCGSPGNLTGILLKNLPLQGMNCPPVNTDTPGSTDSGVISTAVLFPGTTNSDSTIMTTATDPATDSLTTATEPATDSLTIATDPATESSTTARDLALTCKHIMVPVQPSSLGSCGGLCSTFNAGGELIIVNMKRH